MLAWRLSTFGNRQIRGNNEDTDRCIMIFEIEHTSIDVEVEGRQEYHIGFCEKITHFIAGSVQKGPLHFEFNGTPRSRESHAHRLAEIQVVLEFLTVQISQLH